MSSPVFVSNNPYTYFTCDRNPTPTEPDVTSIGIPSDWIVHWWNTTSMDLFQLQNRTAGSLIWQKIVTNANFSSVASLSLPAVAISGSYNDLSNKPSIPASQIQSDWAQANSSSLDFIKNKPTIPSGQLQSDWNQTNSSSVDYIKNKPPTRSQSSATRSLNTIFQISSTRDSNVNYSVDVATTATLLGGQTGTVYLEISLSSTFASGIQELARFVNGNTVSLAIAITVNQNVTGTMSGYVPAGYYVRLRTENTTGSPSFTYRSGQEILL